MSKGVRAKYPPVEIHWCDSATNAGWFDKEGVKKWGKNPFNIVTVGYLVKKGKKILTIATAIGLDGDSFGSPWKIPVGCVSKIKYLRKKR